MLKSFVGHAGAEFNTDHIDEDAWAGIADKMTYISGDLTNLISMNKCAPPSTRPKKLTAPVATPSFISPLRIGYSVPSWSNWAKPSSPIRARTRTAAASSAPVVIGKPFGHSLDFGARFEFSDLADAA